MPRQRRILSSFSRDTPRHFLPKPVSNRPKELTLAIPRQRTSAPILVVSILLGLLLSPVLERALASWMPGAVTVRDAQQKSRRTGQGSDHNATWDLRSM